MFQPYIIKFLPGDYFNSYYNITTTAAPPVTTSMAPLMLASFAATPAFMCAFPGPRARAIVNNSQCPFDTYTQCVRVDQVTCNRVEWGSTVVYAQASIGLVNNTLLYGAALFSDDTCSNALLGADISVSNLTLGQCGPLGTNSQASLVRRHI